MLDPSNLSGNFRLEAEARIRSLRHVRRLALDNLNLRSRNATPRELRAATRRLRLIATDANIKEALIELRDMRADLLKRAEQMGRLEKKLRRIFKGNTHG